LLKSGGEHQKSINQSIKISQLHVWYTLIWYFITAYINIHWSVCSNGENVGTN
jgi:hypothetical protein